MRRLLLALTIALAVPAPAAAADPRLQGPGTDRQGREGPAGADPLAQAVRVPQRPRLRAVPDRRRRDRPDRGRRRHAGGAALPRAPQDRHARRGRDPLPAQAPRDLGLVGRPRRLAARRLRGRLPDRRLAGPARADQAPGGVPGVHPRREGPLQRPAARAGREPDRARREGPGQGGLRGRRDRHRGRNGSRRRLRRQQAQGRGALLQAPLRPHGPHARDAGDHRARVRAGEHVHDRARRDERDRQLERRPEGPAPRGDRVPGLRRGRRRRALQRLPGLRGPRRDARPRSSRRRSTTAPSTTPTTGAGCSRPALRPAIRPAPSRTSANRRRSSARSPSARTTA